MKLAGRDDIFEPTRLFSKATQVLVTAMQEARVKRRFQKGRVWGPLSADRPAPLLP
jgi:hypothetical protein